MGSYETAWSILQKMRRAMLEPYPALLHQVKLCSARARDVVDIRGYQKTLENSWIVIVVGYPPVSEHFRAIVRVVLLSGNFKENMRDFVMNNVESNRSIRTDDYGSYSFLEKEGYVIRISHENRDTFIAARMMSKLRHWIKRTYHGGVSTSYLQFYLDEFSFLASTYHGTERDLWPDEPDEHFRDLLTRMLSISTSNYRQIVDDSGRERWDRYSLMEHLRCRSDTYDYLKWTPWELERPRSNAPAHCMRIIPKAREIIGYCTGSTVSQIVDHWSIIINWILERQYSVRGLFADLSAETSAYQPDL